MILQDTIALLWFVIDAVTHLTIELGYLYLALTATAQHSDSFLGHIWREYGRADTRWAIRDANIISLEIITVAVMGPLCLLQAYGVYYKASWRYPLQIIICVAELYGGWMTFAPEVLASTHYLVFMNGLWVVLPVLLLWDSFAQITEACKLTFNDKKSPRPAPGAPSKIWYSLAAGTILLYVVLVPCILFTAEGVPVGSLRSVKDWPIVEDFSN